MIQVLEQMPISILPEGEAALHLFILPMGTALGTKADDFSNVSMAKYAEGQRTPCEPGEVCVVPKGKLGVLPMGLLHVADVVVRWQREDVVQKSLETTSQRLALKRTGWGCLQP